MRSPALALVALVFAIPTGAEAKFTLGGPEPPVLDIAGQVKFGPEFMLDAAEDEPFVSFNNTAASLLLTGSLTRRLDWMIHASMAGGVFTLYECFANWKPLDALALVAGQQKAPFGRVYNSAATKLLFMTRNPLAADFAPKYQLGVTPVVSLPGGWGAVKAGVFNGEGPNRANPDPGLLYSACVEVTPLGAVPNEESANRGYAEPVVALIPGFWTNRAGPVLGVEVTTTAYGGHAAFRWQFLALDAAFYRRREERSPGNRVATSDGLTVQGGYAFAGRYEPIARVTMVGLDDATTTIEAGFNWYFNSYASRLGLNFGHRRPAEGDARQEARLYYEFQF
ncbi:MAG: porin [bacterium]